MAQPVIAPVIPNIGQQGEAIAGSSAVIFTATDRQVIKERAGEVDRARTFKELFSEKGLAPEVENEETTVKPEPDVKALESRYHEHRRALKHSPLTVPREHIEISNGTIEETLAPSAVITKPEEPVPQTQAIQRLVEELNLNPAEIFDKFALEQKELYNLICRIKELHLKRLLCNSRQEFEEYSELIKKETLAASRPEARPWLETQLDRLTQNAAEYKAKLSESLKKLQ